MFALKASHPRSRPTENRIRSAIASQRYRPRSANGPDETITAEGIGSRSSWDFGKIPLFSPDHSLRAAERSRTAAPLTGALQTKLVVGAANDPLEREADAVADAMMRTPDPPLAVSAAPPQVNRECAECEEEDKQKLQRKAAGEAATRSVSEAPPIVHEALRESGLPLDAATRAFFEPRLGADLAAVRVHTGKLASASAEATNANAYTVGEHIVFRDGSYAPATSTGLRLISHELAHVAQQTGVPETAGGSTGEAAALRRRSGPLVQRDIHLKDAVPNLGSFAFEGKPTGNGLGAHEDVTITFSPDPLSPAADSIDFVQIAKPPASEKPGDWAVDHPDEKLKSDAATTAGSATHLTQQGDTLASVSIQHFGTADRAAEILEANQGRLTWWSAQSGGQPDDRLSRPLPSAIVLTIPKAVRGGFMVDIKPQGVSPRAKRDDSNVSPNYPGQGVMTPMGSMIARVNGFKHADGSMHDAQMTDLPGGGAISGRFEFESAAFAKDIGLYYGAIKWGFNYSFNGITNEYAQLVPKVSDTFNAANVAFNKVYKNKHVVRQGETLNSISVAYYGTTDNARSIYLTNQTVLSTDDPMAPIAGGTLLEVGAGPTIWDRARSGSSEP
jgi:hypothetical protein